MSDAGDPWISAAILNAGAPFARALFPDLFANATFRKAAHGEPFLAELAANMGHGRRRSDVERVLAAAGGEHPRFAIVAALAEGLQRAKTSLAANAPAEQLAAVYTGAREQLRAADASAQSRADAAKLLAFDSSTESRAALIAALSGTVGGAVLEALAQRQEPEIVPELIAAWPRLDPAVRAQVASFLAARPVGAVALLQAVEAQSVAATELPDSAVKLLRASRNETVSALAAKLLPKPSTETRDDVISRFGPALQLAGDAAHGRELFTQRCATCHRFRGEGQGFGPDLESVVGGGKAKLLVHLIDPNREVAPQFAAYLAELKNGTVLSGIVVSDTTTEVVIREPLGKETRLSRVQLTRLQTTGRSPMPEGLEAGLSMQDVADLLEYLTTVPAR
jgi:putative heme-binding domain-containing protein